MTKTTKNGPGGIKLVLDTEDSATPAMVYGGAREAFSASYDCGRARWT